MAPSGPPLDDERHLLRWEDAEGVQGGMRFIFERLGGVLPDVGIPSDEESEDEELDVVGMPGEVLVFFGPFLRPLSSDKEEEETEDEETDEEEDEDPENEDAWGDEEEDSEDSGDWSTSEHEEDSEEDSEDDSEDDLFHLNPPADFWCEWEHQDPPTPPPPPEELPSGSAPSTSGLSVSTKRTREEDDIDQVGMKRQRRTSEEDSDSD